MCSRRTTQPNSFQNSIPTELSDSVVEDTCELTRTVIRDVQNLKQAGMFTVNSVSLGNFKQQNRCEDVL